MERAKEIVKENNNKTRKKNKKTYISRPKKIRIDCVYSYELYEWESSPHQGRQLQLRHARLRCAKTPRIYGATFHYLDVCRVAL